MRNFVFAFLGKENTLKEEAVAALKSQVLAGGNTDLNYSLLRSEDLEPSDFKEAVNTQPFLSPKRFVVLKDIETLNKSAANAVSAYLENPSKTTVLVLTTDLWERELKSSDNPLFCAILKYAGIQTFDPLNAEGLSSYLKKKFALNGKTAQDDALQLLVEKLGNNTGNLNRAVEGLVTYVGIKQMVERKDVEALIGKSLEEFVFNLTKAICRRQTAQSLSILSSLFNSVGAENIIGAIGAELRRIMRVKDLIKQGRSLWQIQKEAGLRNPQEVSEAIAIANGMDLDEVKQWFAHLLKADYDCKNRNLDKKVVLESLVVKLSDFSKLA